MEIRTAAAGKPGSLRFRSRHKRWKLLDSVPRESAIPRFRTAIVILNWNGWRDTVHCLESVLPLSSPECRLVVIDNGSDDDSLTRLTAWNMGTAHGDDEVQPLVVYQRSEAEAGGIPEVEQRYAASETPPPVVISTGANLGFAGGNNVGIRYALANGAEYILLLNNDAWFRTADGLAAMIAFMDRTPRAGACGARLFYPDGAPQHSYGNFPRAARTMACLFPLHKLLPHRWLAGMHRSNVIPDPSLGEPLRIDWPCGACLLVRAAMIRQVGMLDEQYFLYLEETDWCLRMNAHGWDRYYLPDAEVVHRLGESVRKSSVSMQQYHLDSQFVYFLKHFSAGSLLLVLIGYLCRSGCSLLFWRFMMLLSGGEQRQQAGERADYWRCVLQRSVEASRTLLSRHRRRIPAGSWHISSVPRGAYEKIYP